MSYVAGFDDGDSVQIASNNGYDHFATWAGALNVKDYPVVRHLVAHGWEDDIAGLVTQLGGAVQVTKPSEEVAGIASGIVAAVTGKGAVVISQGFEGDSEVGVKSFEQEKPADPWQGY